MENLIITVPIVAVCIIIIYLLYRVVKKEEQIIEYASHISDLCQDLIDNENPVTSDTGSELARVEQTLLPIELPKPKASSNPYGEGDLVTVTLKSTSGMAESWFDMAVKQVSGDELKVEAEDPEQESIMRSYGYDIPIWVKYTEVKTKSKVSHG